MYKCKNTDHNCPYQRPAVNQKFLPQLVLETSPFRLAKILNSNPTGKPTIAAFNGHCYDGTSRSLDVSIANHSTNDEVRQTWHDWLAARPRTPEDVDPSCLPTWNWALIPVGGPTGSHRANARLRAMARFGVRRRTASSTTRLKQMLFVDAMLQRQLQHRRRR